MSLIEKFQVDVTGELPKDAILNGKPNDYFIADSLIRQAAWYIADVVSDVVNLGDIEFIITDIYNDKNQFIALLNTWRKDSHSIHRSIDNGIPYIVKFRNSEYCYVLIKSKVDNSLIAVSRNKQFETTYHAANARFMENESYPYHFFPSFIKVTRNLDIQSIYATKDKKFISYLPKQENYTLIEFAITHVDIKSKSLDVLRTDYFTDTSVHMNNRYVETFREALSVSEANYKRKNWVIGGLPYNIYEAIMYGHPETECLSKCDIINTHNMAKLLWT